MPPIATATAPTPVVEDPWDLDMRVVEASIPIPKMLCSTGDGCGSSCSTSACTTNVADPS
ncbi:FxLD family lanthipeptide [Nonomuraea fastidiosa]|jgi:FxLD family lantipeptide|uniref:FxLD family lanthipeptide n=1 Tax=Nonomuraea TaxID=83681 RepID=UPI00366CFDDA